MRHGQFIIEGLKREGVRDIGDKMKDTSVKENKEINNGEKRKKRGSPEHNERI